MKTDFHQIINTKIKRQLKSENKKEKTKETKKGGEK